MAQLVQADQTQAVTKTCKKQAMVTRLNLSDGDIKRLVNVIQGFNIPVGWPQSSKHSFSKEIRDCSSYKSVLLCFDPFVSFLCGFLCVA